MDFKAIQRSLGNFNILIVLVLLIGFATCQQEDTTRQNPTFQKLHCYQCANQASNANCSRKSDLKPCSTAFTSNVCSTKVEFDPQNGQRITKQCSTGPCSLDKQQSSALGLASLCDLSRPSWSCTYCCYGDGCNISVANQIALTYKLLIAFALLQIVALIYP